MMAEMRAFQEAVLRHPPALFGGKDPFVCAAIQRHLDHQEAMDRARRELGEPPQPGETDADYLARADAALSYVPPEPTVELKNEAPVRGRFCVLPPGSVVWTERGWDAVTRDAVRRLTTLPSVS